MIRKSLKFSKQLDVKSYFDVRKGLNSRSKEIIYLTKIFLNTFPSVFLLIQIFIFQNGKKIKIDDKQLLILNT